MFLYDFIVNITPVVIASWDSGFYGIDQKTLRYDLFAWAHTNKKDS